MAIRGGRSRDVGPTGLKFDKETTHGLVWWPRHESRRAQVFLVRAQDMDNIINVEVASEFPGGLGYSYFPAAFVLEIGYKQVTALTQRLQ